MSQTKETKSVVVKSDKNKDTELVGLEFNVKPFRKWLKEHFERHQKQVGVINAHYVLSTVDQIVTFSLLTSLSDSFEKTTAGLYDVSIDKIKTCVKLTPYYNTTYSLCLDKYDENLDYQKQLCIDKKLFTSYFNKQVFHDNFRMNLSKDSTNFLCYLLVQTNIMLANTALIIAECVKKSRVNANMMVSAIKVHFSGKLYNDIMQKVDSVVTLLQNKDKQDSEKDEEKEENKTNQKVESHTDENESGSEKEKDDSDVEKESEKESETESESEDEKPVKKQTVQKESKQESKSESKQESKQESKSESKQESKQESKSESKQESKPKKVTKSKK